MSSLFTDRHLISFDLDDTLWPGMPTILRAEDTLYQWLQQYYPCITQSYSIQDYYQLRKKIKQQHPIPAQDLTWLRKYSLSLLAKQFHYSHQLVEKGFEIFIKARNQVTFYPDTIEVLEILKKHYTLIAITNGNACIKTIGLDKYFDFSLSPTQAGVAKPNPDIYLQAYKKAKTLPKYCIHIGDDPYLDIDSVHTLQTASIWVNHHTNPKAWPKEIPHRPHYIVQTLSELIPLLIHPLQKKDPDRGRHTLSKYEPGK